jgi:5-methyltetrahydropteroyltriglutamate--homocysteine methyltransferase
VDPIAKHDYSPNASFDGGELDCGNGLLLLIRQQIDPLNEGQLLEIRSTEASVEVDLPAWCRLTNNQLVSWVKSDNQRSFLISKGPFMTQPMNQPGAPTISHVSASSTVDEAFTAIEPVPVLEVEPLSVMGIGSWPRPSWLLRSLHEYLENKVSEEDFQTIANDAVELALNAQVQSGVNVVTDGEQRRDSYAGFVGKKLHGCQLIPLTDLLPLVDNPSEFAAKLKSLDVPAEKVRHPGVFGKLKRRRPLVLNEFKFLRRKTTLPIKIAVPGPYLLTRTMWMDCISDKIYASREALADDVVKILSEEIGELLRAGVSMVQLDEPVLTEVVFGGEQKKSAVNFMCGTLSERLPTAEELTFAIELINRVLDGLPRSRMAVHICRGNWTPDQSLALEGDYLPLVPVFHKVKVGTFFLEFCTPRAGDLQILKYFPADVRVGVGLVNPKDQFVENVDDVFVRAKAAANLIGKERLFLTPDCGFATFADNPVATADLARSKLSVLAQVAQKLRSES